MTKNSNSILQPTDVYQCFMLATGNKINSTANNNHPIRYTLKNKDKFC
jgi:hypothetical protein